ncbi:MAG: hypothetical protein Q8P45_00175, partial [Candidatus Harrisonbacteria bacterium]|nr:hypothetical protein [Candidatus Harrisonbacteria bacterium]
DANIVRNVILRGNWYVGDGGTPPGGLNIPEPPKGVKKVILNFNFGDDGNVNLEDFYLIGPDGRAGEDDSGSCSVSGKKGEDGFRMRVKAANVTLNSFTLELGDGGSGGMAETGKDCENGVATGGAGGQASNFKITAVGKIEINSFKLFPGMGGAGGEAIAYGKDGATNCPGEKGGDATATGGAGGVNKKSLAALGAVSGIANVEIDTVLGGGGGEASAIPGKGGAGDKCGCTGGQGGSGAATGGKGGDASATAPVPVTSQGGDGGNAELRGGEGGTGGSCGPENQGGAGGAGGSASAKAGIAGTGQSSNGTDGTIKDQTGGNGGKGGDGCEEGAGGAGGSGDPDGEKGADGENLCAAEKEEGGGVDIRKQETSTETLDVIEYNGKFLPVSQLIIESESGCDGGQAHWHAAAGVVMATDGSQVADPGPQCGYGKTKDRPVKKIELKAEASSGQTQAEVFFDGEFR